MKTYEEMTRIVLHRIEEEKIPRWKSVLLLIVKYIIILILIVVLVTAIFFLLNILKPFTQWSLID